MDVAQAIRTRRSIRQYGPEKISRPLLEQLIEAATLAPSAMNGQPWAFGVITDPKALRDFAQRGRRILVEKLPETPWLEPLRSRLEDPTFDMFYSGPAVIVIYGRPTSPTIRGDCSLAAMNLMLAAWEAGLGSCWIGLAITLLNQPEVKEELGVPANYEAIAPILLGHPAEEGRPMQRKPPEVLFWK